MTGSNNPLANRGSSGGGSTPPFVSLKNGEQVPTDIYDYCAWLNWKEKRAGAWDVVKVDPERADSRHTVFFRPQIGTAEFLQGKGLAPDMGRVR